MSEELIQCIEIEPASISHLDTEVVPVYTETWREVLETLEQILEGYYLENGWKGTLDIKIKFRNLRTKELKELEWQD